jgi:hypothetical protein
VEFCFAVPGPNIKGARIALAGAAATYLEGTGISWRELLPRVRAELERD